MDNFIEKIFTDMLISFYGDGENDFYDFLEDDVMWYGPLEGQIIKGRDELKSVLYAGNRSLRFHIDSMSTKLFPLKADVLLIIARYTLAAYYPNGKIVNYDQHALIVLRRKKDENKGFIWKCPLIHISDVLYKENRDSSYTLYLDEKKKQSFEKIISRSDSSKKIIFTGEGNSSYFINAETIRFIEGAKGVKSYVYTTDGKYTVNHLLKDIEGRLPECFYRCHASYIVNLDYAKKVSGYKITLDDGEEIPIPVKKYSAVKQYIEEYLGGEAK